MSNSEKKANLLWVDLEMTGLEPEKDRIMEVAAIATDWEFNEIASMTATVKVDLEIIEKRMTGKFWEENAESKRALVKANETGESSGEVERKLLEFLDGYFVKDEKSSEIGEKSDFAAEIAVDEKNDSAKKSKKYPDKNTIYLAGNSIHQDRRFIRHEWPALDKKLHYRMLDVSAWKVYFENALGTHFNKPEKHRALDDIKGSIEELKYYLKKLR